MNKIQALYLHVPFCQSICTYCDFKRIIFNDNKVQLWLKQIQNEITMSDINTDLKTIYIGGGTPSCLTLSQLDYLLTILEPYSHNVEENTIESNNEDLLLCLNKHGVNRISLGVQSFDNKLLKLMGRKHHYEDVLRAIKLINTSGISNISIDLIYGFKEQSTNEWQHTFDILATIPEIKHISVYSLTIEPESFLGKKHYQGCDNDAEAMMFEIAIKRLTALGFHHYEVANFAKPGYESKHNQVYWHYEDFYGIGVGASSKINHCRYDNDGTVEEYLNNGVSKTTITLTKKDEIFEFLMMGLRLYQGISRQEFKNRFKFDLMAVFNDIIEKEVHLGMMSIDIDYLRVTAKGMFFFNDILVEIMEVQDERANRVI